MNYDLIVVGSGIASLSFLYHLGRSGVAREKKVLLLSNDHLNPTCSMRSTGVVAAHGIRSGTSPKGDILSESYQETKKHFSQDVPAGVEQGVRYYLDDEVDIVGRFGSTGEVNLPFGGKVAGVQEDCYLIRANIYLKWLKAQIELDIPNFQKEFKTLVSINDQLELKTLEGDTYQTKNVFMGVGAYSPQWGIWPLNRRLDKKCRDIIGHYFEWKQVNLGNKSFVYSRNNLNVVYRSSDETLLLGGSTQKEGLWNDTEDIYKQYEQVSELWSDLNFPSVEKALLITGLRQKALKGMPFWGKTSHPNIYSVQGLYKNGWTVSHLASKQIVSEIKL